MTNWREKIELYKVIREVQAEFNLSDDSDVCPIEVKEKLAAEIEKSWLLSTYGRKIREAITVEDVNNILDKVFDRADSNRIWCGF